MISHITFFFRVIGNGSFRSVKNLFLTIPTLSIEPNYVYSQPIRLNLEPTTRCNLECQMCYHATLRRPQEDLSFKNFLKILDCFPYLQDLQLQGIGEPLLNLDIFKMIKYAKTRRIRVGIFTNATLINPDMAEKIANSGLDWVNLSLDGANPNTYEMIRKGADFKEVIKNIKILIEINRRKIPKISIWFTAMTINIQELPTIIGLAKRLGIDRIVAQGIHFWGQNSMRDYLKMDSLAQDIDLTQKTFIQARKEAKRLKVKLDFRPRYFEKRTKRVCRWPWVSCFITVEGFVTPCCVQGSDPMIINFGNIFDKGFKEIWNSLQYQDFRRQLKSKCLPEICRDCPGYYYK